MKAITPRWRFPRRLLGLNSGRAPLWERASQIKVRRFEPAGAGITSRSIDRILLAPCGWWKARLAPEGACETSSDFASLEQLAACIFSH